MGTNTFLENSTKTHQKYHARTRSSRKIIKKNNFTYRLLISAIDPYLNKKSGLKILDIGCGAGSMTFFFASRGHHVTGIDISSKAIRECEKSAKAIGMNNTKFMVKAFPEESNIKEKFDIVIFTEVIEHIKNDKLAVKEIAKLLKNNGLLILSTPSSKAPLHRLKLTKKFDEEVGHLRRYTLEELRKILHESKFRIIDTKKTEGILRNFLFVNPYAGKLVRYINRFGSDPFTILDNLCVKLLGESNYIIVARKKS